MPLDTIRCLTAAEWIHIMDSLRSIAVFQALMLTSEYFCPF